MITIKMAVYKDNSIKILKLNSDSQMFYHIRGGARIAEVEIDYEKLPDYKPVFGQLCVKNQMDIKI